MNGLTEPAERYTIFMMKNILREQIVPVRTYGPDDKVIKSFNPELPRK